jgi:hypothetical protein
LCMSFLTTGKFSFLSEHQFSFLWVLIFLTVV